MKKTTRKSKSPPIQSPSILRRALGFLGAVYDVLKTLLLFQFIARYWVLLVLLGLFLTLIFSNVLFKAVGAVFCFPVLALGAMAAALLLRNVFNGETSDDDADTGRFVQEWRALDPRTRVILSVVQILVYYLGACIAIGYIAGGR